MHMLPQPRPRHALIALLCVATLLAACGKAPGTPASATVEPAPSPTRLTLTMATPRPTASPPPTAVLTADRAITTSWRDGWLAFTLIASGNVNIYKIRADGSELTQLTDGPGRNIQPVWSPDGNHILFASNRDEPNPTTCGQTPSGDDSQCNYKLYVMDTDGSNPRRLTNHPLTDELPAWSPDSSQIAFTSLRDGHVNIYKMQADGSNVVQLTTGKYEAKSPVWSPDGKHIAYTALNFGANDIFVMQADGGGKTSLTNHPADDITPSWSPDGSQIAFVSTREGLPTLYLMRPDGGEVERLPTSYLVDGYPASWSPDGSHLAYVSNRTGHRELAVVNVRTDQVTQVTWLKERAVSPTWAPSFVDPPTAGDAPVASVAHNAALRHAPDPDAYILDLVSAGEPVELLQRSEASDWLSVRNERAVTGWVERDAVAVEEAQVQGLSVAAPEEDTPLPRTRPLAPLVPFEEPVLGVRGLRPEGWSGRDEERTFMIYSAPGAMDLFAMEELPLDDRSFAGVANLSKAMIDTSLNGTYETRLLMGEVLRKDEYLDGTRSALVTYTMRRLQIVPTKYMRMVAYIRTHLTPDGLLVVYGGMPISEFDAQGQLLIQMVDSVEPQEVAP